jgi:hypothetical protein
LFDPRREHFFRPDQRNPPASARSGGQGWPRSRGHPKGLSLYGAFEVKHLFHGILHFLPSSFFV